MKESMDSYTILFRVLLSSRHKPTGKTHHYQSDQELPTPSELQIVKYAEDPGYYLLYIDANGGELTDTYHDSLTLAFEQAEWEFQIKPDEWKASSNPTLE
jgi:hypothetical protein